jgi:uracil-DNA glycosylase
MKVVFVGDKPSRLNDDPSIAFVGTPSFTNLCKWIAKMEVSNFIMVNSWTHADSIEICRLLNEGDKVFVALGNYASKRLNDMFIQHFKLPHPSPKNRMLNNKANIEFQLNKCYLYIKEQSKCV